MNIQLNPHYDFESQENKTYQIEVLAYNKAFKDCDKTYLQKAEQKALKGAEGYTIGVDVESPWGDNKILSVGREKAADSIIKEITVKPGFMLSLQRHRGRTELWEVKCGTLTVILDGQSYQMEVGDSITIPKGAVHCMGNIYDKPITVMETQIGLCRESDNIRLIDSNNRPTFPLSTIVEGKSAMIYAEMYNEIKNKFKQKDFILDALLGKKYKDYLNQEY